ncbi:D-alanyl-D-alanine carboxypeptidase [Sphaerisporangium melleum]|uniref:D-alanyl-D-alanine carboxypeptidase n=1 Tax=Sphaerisporangium melleum TaxID=321316 RepID=A0A917RLW8_9ACTN|nr:serine hydrolase [Sphaerisporangium melleum]GGL13754.1 D-alanyl-D-alanine carboxypeptidase [Sphaerisporangium melleum]GII74628.1 D-alanyl-D-alanine carboxypeptidase [Sphaerisporangium melleum]
MRNRNLLAGLCVTVSALVTGVVSPASAQPAAAPALSRQATAWTGGISAHGHAARRAPDVYGRATYLLDASTGTALLDDNGAERMPIASLTKVMTAYVVLREARTTDQVTITAADVGHADDNGGTSADLRPGERLTVGQLLYGVMLPSGADAAHALARVYGPGVDGFVGKMNAAAKDLGLRDTRYVNADGLPMPGGDGYSTARDQARLAAAALRDPAFEKITSTETYSVGETGDHRAHTWTNSNHLLGDPGVIGVKTGFTNAAGFCLTFAADREGHRLIGVILGEDVSSRRFSTAESLLDWGARATGS